MKKERGNTLVATMVVMVIMCVLAIALFKGGVFGTKGTTPVRKDGHGTTVLGAPEWAAKDEVCRSNLSQLRQSLQIAQMNNDDKFPQTLEETRLGAQFYSCPLGHEPYVYDPSTGQVHCPHPGHEQF